MSFDYNLDISVNVDDKRWLIFAEENTVNSVMRNVLCHAKLLHGYKGVIEIGVIFTDNAEIQTLNRTYRGKDKPTNVLSFSPHHHFQDDISKLMKEDNLELGDIILAYETIETEANEQNKSFINHAIHLLVHGNLHLLGYNHEEDSEAQIMESIEIQILESMGIENPYEKA